MVTDFQFKEENKYSSNYKATFNMTLGGVNVEGKNVYIYYFEKEMNSTTAYDTNYAGVFVPPCTVSWKWNTKSDRYQYVLFSDKELNVNTVKTDVPLKHWYKFIPDAYYLSTSNDWSGLNPYKEDKVYQPRR